jgi:hypothetical protein
MFRWFGPLTFVIFLTACSISKPCSEGGDISWTPKITGDKRCTQKVLPDGRQVNDGPFRQVYESNREIALEGEFLNGQKQGIWLHYGEDRKLKSAKYFEKGVEKTPPAEIQKQIDLIIEQKTGVK